MITLTRLTDATQTNGASSYTATPVQDYIDLALSGYPYFSQYVLHWINAVGYQEKDTDGNYSGSAPVGKIPPGQTRLARTLSTQLHLQASHSGFGDGYVIFSSMAVTQHPDTNLDTTWSGQNSGGLIGAQINALTDQVNLYGFGDVVLNDKSHASVAMWGRTLFLTHSGADGVYSVPRVGELIHSNGTGYCDAALLIYGKFTQAIDLSNATLATHAAIALKQGDGVYWAATAPDTTTGKFTSPDVGTNFTSFDGTYLIDTLSSVGILKRKVDKVEIHPGGNSTDITRVYGSSATSFLMLGQFNTTSYLSAASSGTDDTVLIFQTAASGVEAERMRITSAGVVLLANTPTYADNAAAVAGGLAVTSVYKTATGEMRIVV